MTPQAQSWAACLPPAILFLLALGFVVLGYGYAGQAATVPLLIGWSMLLLTALDLASRLPIRAGATLLRWLNPAALTDSAAAAPRARQVIAIGGAIGFVALMLLTGILIAVPVFVCVALRFGAARSWLFSLLLAGLTTLFIWALFTPLLGLDLFPGLLFGGEW